MKRNVLLAILAVLAVCVCAGVYFYLQEDGCLAQTTAKPVIYLYPQEETAVNVTLDYDGKLTSTYPKYTSGWSVTARPDGTLTDGAGQSYNYLYWEGEDRNEYDFSRGFCVAGADSAAFLEDALARLGLTRINLGRQRLAARGQQEGAPPSHQSMLSHLSPPSFISLP